MWVALTAKHSKVEAVADLLRPEHERIAALDRDRHVERPLATHGGPHETRFCGAPRAKASILPSVVTMMRRTASSVL